MAVVVGIDVAKEFHWVAMVVAESGKTLLSQRVDNDPESIAELITHLHRVATEHGPATAGIDLMGGIAGLLTAMLTDADVRLVHVPGLVVNRARRATRGGEAKSDRRGTRRPSPTNCGCVTIGARSPPATRPPWICGCWCPDAANSWSTRPAAWPGCGNC